MALSFTALTGASNNAGGSSQTTPGSTTPASGFIALACVLQSENVSSVTDNKGNSYTKVWESQAEPGSGSKVGVWACVGAVGGSGHTFTMNGGVQYASIFPAYVTGYDTTTPWTTTPLVQGTGSGNSLALNQPTLPQANCLLLYPILVNGAGDAPPMTPPSGFSSWFSQGDWNYWTGFASYMATSATTAATRTATGSAWNSTTGGILGIREAAASGSAITPADGSATTSTLTGRVNAVRAATAAAGVATTSTLAGRRTALSTPAAAAGTATASGLVGSRTAAATITAADGVATAGTLVGAAGAPDSSSITPAAGSATAAALSASSTASASMVPAGGVAFTETLTSNGEPPAVTIGKGFEMGGSAPARRIREVSIKPLMQRVLEARSAKRIRPKADRAADRAKRIEVQAAQMLLDDDATRAEFEGLMTAWRTQRPQVPEKTAPMEAFMSQVAFRIEQMGEMQRAEELAQAQRRSKNDEEALFLLLMA